MLYLPVNPTEPRRAALGSTNEMRAAPRRRECGTVM